MLAICAGTKCVAGNASPLSSKIFDIFMRHDTRVRKQAPLHYFQKFFCFFRRTPSPRYAMLRALRGKSG